MLNCQAYNSHVWFIPTDEETAICTLLQFQSKCIQGRFTHKGAGRSTAVIFPSLEIQKMYFCLQMLGATKAKPGRAAFDKLMSLQISYVSWSFIISLVGCFTSTCFSHRWDIVNDMTASSPPLPQSNRNPLISGCNQKKLRFQGKIFQWRNHSAALEKIAYWSFRVINKNTRKSSTSIRSDILSSYYYHQEWPKQKWYRLIQPCFPLIIYRIFLR